MEGERQKTCASIMKRNRHRVSISQAWRELQKDYFQALGFKDDAENIIITLSCDTPLFQLPFLRWDFGRF